MLEFPHNFWVGNNRKMSQFKQRLVCHHHTFCLAEMHVHVASASTALTVSSWLDLGKVYLIMKKRFLFLLTCEEVASTSCLCFLVYLP